MKLRDLIDLHVLAGHAKAGHITEVRHPAEPLVLLNYTNRCQFENAWDDVTRVCRGLIYRTDTEEIVARPFPKFHNLHEHADGSHAGPIQLVPPLRVFDKLDGSLGIAYRAPSTGEVCWATRGSFTSAQALWATLWWREHGADYEDLMRSVFDTHTYLAEIIYPANRIVLDYGDREGLVLLAILDTNNAYQVAPTSSEDHRYLEWPGDVVTMYGKANDITKIDVEERPDTEGYVVLSGDLRTRVKIKTAEYMRLHKILTGVTTVTVWEMLRNGDPLDVLYDKVPDEFAAWAKATALRLEADWTRARDAAYEHYRLLADQGLDHPDYRKEAAGVIIASGTPYRGVLFKMLDGKRVTDDLWKMVKPDRELPYITVGWSG